MPHDERAMVRIDELWEELDVPRNHWKQLAGRLDCNRGLLWDVAHGKKRSHAINRAIGIEKPQIRLCATLTEEEREAGKRLALEFGLTWTEFVRVLIHCYTDNLWRTRNALGVIETSKYILSQDN